MRLSNMVYTKSLKLKVIDIDANYPVAVLNHHTAKALSMKPLDRLQIKGKKSKATCILDTTETYVDDGTVGIFGDMAKELGFTNGEQVEVNLMAHPDSVDYIIKKIRNQPLTDQQIHRIVEDVLQNNLSEIEISAFLTAAYINGLNLEETISFSKALTDTGKIVKFDRKEILDKHSIGGINGRVSMLIVPIISAMGYWIPKTASRSISSAAGTADCMEVLGKVSFTIDELKKIVKETGGIVAWNGRLDLSPVDDKLIKIRHGLGLDPEGILIASILSKKKSAGSTHLVIDVPVGSEVKIHTKEDGERLAKKFVIIGHELGIKTRVLLTDGESPCGKYFGAALEAKGALEILENKYFDNLSEKACRVAGELFELVGRVKEGEGYALAKEVLSSGKALLKFKEIVNAQGGTIFSSQEITKAKLIKQIFAENDGKIEHMSVSKFTEIARLAGAPFDKLSGVVLMKDVGATIKNGELVYEIHAENPDKLEQACDFAKKNNPIVFESMILEEIE